MNFALDKVFGDAPSPFTFSLAVRGKSEDAQEAGEPDNGRPFQVVKAELKENQVEITFSKAPSNATVKGLVELEGAARSYVQVDDKLLKVHFENQKADLVLTLDKNLKDADGNPEVVENGHVYTLKEIDGADYHWDQEVEVVRPML